MHESIRILLLRRSYSIRNHSYQISKCHHQYARNSIAYNLLKLINTTSNLIIENSFILFFFIIHKELVLLIVTLLHVTLQTVLLPRFKYGIHVYGAYMLSQ